jgi:hypothetical protein
MSKVTGSFSDTGEGRQEEGRLPSIFLGGLLAPTDTNTNWKEIKTA